MSSHWQAGTVAVSLERDGQFANLVSISGLSNTTQENVSVRFDDNVGGVGGTITFLRNGVAFGLPQTVAFKPRITPGAIFESNASLGNTANSRNLRIGSISLGVTLLSDVESFVPVTSGTISAADLNQLYVNALSVTAPQQSVALTYIPAGGGAATTVNVVIGPISVPAGVAYRAVLENWSSGAAVSHASVLVMTRPSRQNCQFEDATLAANQVRWMECLPQGPVPVIGGIAYYCEAIRIGSYVQFQFGYDWTAATIASQSVRRSHRQGKLYGSRTSGASKTSTVRSWRLCSAQTAGRSTGPMSPASSKAVLTVTDAPLPTQPTSGIRWVRCVRRLSGARPRPRLTTKPSSMATFRVMT